tara:strand:- start:368 stop:979 length:612 start_codon:yes stop_codon:yes gene_type:complete
MVLLLVGIFMSQVIKMNKNLLKSIFILFLVTPVILFATDENVISNTISKSENSATNSQEELITQKNILNPLSDLNIFLDKKVNSKAELIQNINIQNDKTQLSNQSFNETYTLNEGEFVRVQGIDKIDMLFDGSIIVKFESMPNLANYAITNNIQFITDLSAINRGIFKIQNLYDLQTVINKIKLDENVKEIELKLRDPRLAPE